jgi:hypothetical protein
MSDFFSTIACEALGSNAQTHAAPDEKVAERSFLGHLSLNMMFHIAAGHTIVERSSIKNCSFTSSTVVYFALYGCAPYCTQMVRVVNAARYGFFLNNGMCMN